MNPVPTSFITGNLFAVRIWTVNFFIYMKNEDVICIDTGFCRRIIKRELSSLNIDPLSVSSVFLTHSDIDHTGGLQLFPNAGVFISAAEECMIDGSMARKFGIIYNSGIKRPYRTISDNETVQTGVIKVLALSTPGHTPGSMSYLVDGRYLFSGDTLKLVNGKVYPISRFYNMDGERQTESIGKIAKLRNIEILCTAHSGLCYSFDEFFAGWR